MASKFRRDFKRNAHQNNVMPSTGVPKAFLVQARKTGVLNLSSRELADVPNDVWRLNLDASKDARETGAFGSEANWWEQTDLTKLILASNVLETLSDDVRNFQCLTVLDVHDNKLSSLPDCFSELEMLERLDVSRNQIQQLPLSLFSLQKLKLLKLQYNKLSYLSDEIGNLCNIEALELSNNQLKVLPNSIENMYNLRKVDISHNCLESIPMSLSSLQFLTILDASNNLISNALTEFNCQSLTQLLFTNNKIEKIPVLTNCTKLAELYLGNNKLTKVDFSNLPMSIKILELCDNKIIAIHDDVIKLTQLERLNIANNNVSSLPPRLGAMEYIKAIVLDGNPMKTIRRDIINRGTQEVLKYLRSRIADDDDFSPEGKNQELLPTSHDIKATKSLNLSGKKLSVDNLNKSLCGLEDTKVNSINLSNNLLENLPTNLTLFSDTLKELNLSKNKLSGIMPIVPTLSSLTHLDISGNQLSSLPDDIAHLKNLIEINISVNRFTTLPKSLGTVHSLEHILASGNSITVITPDDLCDLKKLATLALQNNSISQVPPKIVAFPNLKILQLEGNLFKIPRQSILQQGPAAVIEYLRNRLPA